MTTIFSESQILYQTSPYVELYIIDATGLGGGTYHFSPQIYADGTQIAWQGNSYTFIPITSQGWEVLGGANLHGNSQPTPTIVVSNVNKILLSAIVSLGDLVGAVVTRYRTFEKFLDGQTYADSTQYLGPEIFVINQKVTHTNTGIAFQLVNPIDKPNMFLPGRQILKDGKYAFPGVLVYR